jgi:hypothetical protein
MLAWVFYASQDMVDNAFMQSIAGVLETDFAPSNGLIGTILVS